MTKGDLVTIEFDETLLTLAEVKTRLRLILKRALAASDNKYGSPALDLLTTVDNEMLGYINTFANACQLADYPNETLSNIGAQSRFRSAQTIAERHNALVGEEELTLSDVYTVMRELTDESLY